VIAVVLYQTTDEGKRAKQQRDSVLAAECCGERKIASVIK